MEPASDQKTSILFVCLGNICRSPLAEGLFREKVHAAGLEEHFRVASAGTGDWHMGEPPDDRMQAAARRNGDLDLSAQRGQQFARAHFEDFDHIFAMDKSNLHDILFLDEDSQYDGKVRLFREFDPEPGNYQVPDPYAGGREGFDEVYRIADRTTTRILEELIQKVDGREGEKERE
jgi:protein-tyrosine phosphatase